MQTENVHISTVFEVERLDATVDLGGVVALSLGTPLTLLGLLIERLELGIDFCHIRGVPTHTVHHLVLSCHVS